MISETERTLGEALVSAKLMAENDLKMAIKNVETKKAPNLIIELLKSEFLTFKTFQKFLTQNYKIRTAILSDRELPQDLIDELGWDLIESGHALPVMSKMIEGSLKLALGMVNPLDEKVIAEVQKKVRAEVTPLLISLSDFEESLRKYQNMEKMGDRTAIASYEEQLQRLDRIHSLSQKKYFEDQESAMIAGSLAAEKPAAEKAVKPELLRASISRFKEEVLVKLDLDHFEASALEKDRYEADELFDELKKVKKTSLERNFDMMDANLKFEALANALIRKGLLTKLDILVACGVARVFGEVKK